MVVLRAAVLLAYTTKSRGPWRITPRAVGHACGIEELARTLKGVDTDSDDPRFRRYRGAMACEGCRGVRDSYYGVR